MPTKKGPNPFNARVAALPRTLITAELELLDEMFEGEEPALCSGICGNTGHVVFEWADKEQIDSDELTEEADDAITGWMLHEFKHWPSENSSGSRHYPVRCPPGTVTPLSALSVKPEDYEEVKARWMYGEAVRSDTLYDQKTEYGRSRAELAGYLAEKLREAIKGAEHGTDIP